MEPDPTQLVLSCELSEIDRLCAWVRAAASTAPDLAFVLELCAEEAVTNVIMHGSAAKTVHSIVVTFAENPSSIVLAIQDDGLAFDPTAAVTPEIPLTVEQARIGGLGIHLIRRLSTEMRYDRVDDCNRLTLTFARAA